MRFFAWFLVLVLIGVIGYMLFFSPFLRIKEIVIAGEDNLRNEEILPVVKGSLQGKYFDFLERDNFILASEKDIREGLLERFKRIESVEVAKEFPNKISVDIKERKSMLIFCDGACWVIDEKGQVFMEADFSSNELGEHDLIVLRNIQQKNIPKEDVYIENNLMQFAIEIKDKLKSELGIEIEKEYFTPALISGDLRIKTSEGWKIYFNKNLGTKKTFEMLKVILDNNIDADKRADLDYIDLRVSNKAYYKSKKAEEIKDEDKKDNLE